MYHVYFGPMLCKLFFSSIDLMLQPVSDNAFKLGLKVQQQSFGNDLTIKKKTP